MGKIIKQISQALKNSKYTEAKMFNLKQEIDKQTSYVKYYIKFSPETIPLSDSQHLKDSSL